MNNFGQPLFPFVLSTMLATTAAHISMPECPHAHAPLANLRLPSDKASFDMCPRGLSHHKGKVAKSEAWPPVSLESALCSSTALQETPIPGKEKLK